MICVIDYDLGNVISIKNAINKIGFECIISNKPSEIISAKALILPGVGSFEKGMKNLKERNLINIISNEVIIKKKLILGICLGFQIMCKNSDEFGIHEGLGWINANVEKINNQNVRIPHVGWNKTELLEADTIFHNIKNNELFYYNHSYCVKKNNDKNFKTIAKCFYGEDFVAIGKKDNIYGIQPHPEKSQKQGLNFLENFLKKIC